MQLKVNCKWLEEMNGAKISNGLRFWWSFNEALRIELKPVGPSVSELIWTFFAKKKKFSCFVLAFKHLLPPSPRPDSDGCDGGATC